MSLGSSTTQISARSRRASWQIWHSGPSARLKHSSQNPIFSFTSRIASARARACSGEYLRITNASRWAVRRPMPGSRASWTIRFSTAGEYNGWVRSHARDAEAAHAAELAHHLLLLHLLCSCDGSVDRGDKEILEHLRVLRIDRLGLDHDLRHLEGARDLDGDSAAAGAVLDVGGLQLFLGLLHLRLHLPQLGHHLVGIDLGQRSVLSL